MPIYEGRADIIPDIDWDTYHAKKEVAQRNTIDLFVEPMSLTKTQLETSMCMSGVFPAPIHKNVTALQIAFGIRNKEEDMNTFREKARYEFLIGQKLYDYGPMSRFQWWNQKLDEKFALFCLQNDIRTIGNEVEYRIGDSPIGHHILQRQMFKFSIKFDYFKWIPLEDFKMVVFLKGIKSRAVA